MAWYLTYTVHCDSCMEDQTFHGLDQQQASQAAHAIGWITVGVTEKNTVNYCPRCVKSATQEQEDRT